MGGRGDGDVDGVRRCDHGGHGDGAREEITEEREAVALQLTLRRLTHTAFGARKEGEEVAHDG